MKKSPVELRRHLQAVGLPMARLRTSRVEPHYTQDGTPRVKKIAEKSTNTQASCTPPVPTDTQVPAQVNGEAPAAREDGPFADARSL